MSMIMSYMLAWQMFGDVWKLYKKYAVRKLNEDELEQLMYEASKIHEKFKYPFTKELLIAVIGEIERSVKHFEMNKNNGKSE